MLKDNQASLHDGIRRCLDDPAAKIHSRFETTDGDHGRIEVRRQMVSHDMNWLTIPRRFPSKPHFPGLRAIAVFDAEVERNGSASLERRHYIPSLPLDAKVLAHAARCHPSEGSLRDGRGCHNAAGLWREAAAAGYTGRPGIVRAWATQP